MSDLSRIVKAYDVRGTVPDQLNEDVARALGVPISLPLAARAADPFFTTKEAGDRMGLGLFLARTLVDSLGGRMQIESTLGRGTTIVVTLPQSR